MVRSITLLATAWLLASASLAQTGGSPVPAFEAAVLSGETVSATKLLGRPTLLIVTLQVWRERSAAVRLLGWSASLASSQL